MRRFQTIVFAISRLAAAISALALVLMVGHILYEIILRYFFATSTFVLDEFVGYGVAACTFMALGYSLEHGNLIRVNLLLARLDGVGRRVVEAGCAALTLGLTSIFIWFFWIRVARNVARGTTSSSIAAVPMWIPEGFVLLGLCVFWLQVFAYFLRQVFDTPPPVEAETANEI
ncbi:TRAP transporter small permease subunit [Jiella avicenniae]|uniref:TRAP transporter small permease protein n=1 Tax=Jiella avicenniae TaxID=2907202 RepID=A0A9X1T756_9HYPH|nr:TRAP transporter small permease [Jiella avicenniae]MCE7030025.1 TRAP transporter small permease [Jiella avicenniae]